VQGYTESCEFFKKHTNPWCLPSSHMYFIFESKSFNSSLLCVLSLQGGVSVEENPMLLNKQIGFPWVWPADSNDQNNLSLRLTYCC